MNEGAGTNMINWMGSPPVGGSRMGNAALTLGGGEQGGVR
jgi:hypothetical protein